MLQHKYKVVIPIYSHPVKQQGKMSELCKKLDEKSGSNEATTKLRRMSKLWKFLEEESHDIKEAKIKLQHTKQKLEKVRENEAFSQTRLGRLKSLVMGDDNIANEIRAASLLETQLAKQTVSLLQAKIDTLIMMGDDNIANEMRASLETQLAKQEMQMAENELLQYLKSGTKNEEIKIVLEDKYKWATKRYHDLQERKCITPLEKKVEEMEKQIIDGHETMKFYVSALDRRLMNPWTKYRNDILIKNKAGKRVVDNGKFRKKVAHFYGLKVMEKQVQVPDKNEHKTIYEIECVVTGVVGSGKMVIAAHLLPVNTPKTFREQFDMRNINVKRNVLPLASNIEKAFDQQRLCFAQKNDDKLDIFTYRLLALDPDVSEEPIYPGSDKKIGDFLTKDIQFGEASPRKSPNTPSSKVLSHHAITAINEAKSKPGWQSSLDDGDYLVNYGSPVRNDTITLEYLNRFHQNSSLASDKGSMDDPVSVSPERRLSFSSRSFNAEESEIEEGIKRNCTSSTVADSADLSS